MQPYVNGSSNKIVTFLKKVVSILKKNTILLIKSLAYTPYYFLYLLCSILTFFCTIQGSYIHLFSKGFICYILFSTFLLSLLLNFSFTYSRIESFLGKIFIDKNLPGFYKGFWPLSFFLTTLPFLDFIEALSVSRRVSDYHKSVNFLEQSIKNLNLEENDFAFTKEVTKLCLDITEIPDFPPSVGILTEISSYICNFF